MILIFGGAYQGKLEYALERFDLTGDDVYHCDEQSAAIPEGKKIIRGLDRWILALVKSGQDVAGQMRRFAELNPNAVVICNDISCGIVPVDEELRGWREAVGNALAILAKDADEVIRLFCSIPTRIK